jgi:polyphosphate kinase 2 (PPK2 family)
MFEAAEVRRTVAKKEYEFEVSKLRWELLDAQRTLERASFPLIVVFGGVDGAGKSETVHVLSGRRSGGSGWPSRRAAGSDSS